MKRFSQPPSQVLTTSEGDGVYGEAACCLVRCSAAGCSLVHGAAVVVDDRWVTTTADDQAAVVSASASNLAPPAFGKHRYGGLGAKPGENILTGASDQVDGYKTTSAADMASVAGAVRTAPAHGFKKVHMRARAWHR